MYWKNDDDELHDIWPDRLDLIAPVPKDSYDTLNPRQRVLYAHERKEFFTWFLDVGKIPEKHKGYSKSSLRPTSTRVDQFYRWVWSEHGGFRRKVNENHFDQYVEDVVAASDWTDNAKRKTVNSIQTLDRYHHDGNWDTPISWNDSTSDSPTDYADHDELVKLRRAATEIGSVPSPSSMTEDEIDEWMSTLAQRWEIPKDDIDKSDFARANSWKIPSLVNVSTDIGPRPWEFQKLTVDMIRFHDDGGGKLVIPKKASTKNEDNWECVLSDQTADILQRWLDERTTYDEYDEDTELIWLTTRGNAWDKQSLRNLMIRLMEEADIDTTNREMGWYLIRRGVATHIANQPDTTLQTVMEQLRIKRTETAARYVKEDEDFVRGVLM